MTDQEKSDIVKRELLGLKVCGKCKREIPKDKIYPAAVFPFPGKICYECYADYLNNGPPNRTVRY